MTPLPAHIAAHIDTVTGLEVSAKGGRNTATATRCPRCHAPILTGLDAEVAAFTVRVDPWPLTNADEATAWLTGRATYRLTDPPRRQLRARDRWQIAGRPAASVTVVADHACGLPLGTPVTPPPARTADDGIPY